MTKRQMHQEINKKFYEFVEANYPHYTIDDNEGGGRIYLISERDDDDFRKYDSIEYHQSRHTVCGYNDNSERGLDDEYEMREFLEKLVPNYDL
jgi:hypothetical protein